MVKNASIVGPPQDLRPLTFDPQLSILICLSSVILCVLTASLALVRNVRSPAYQAFALGMATFAAQTVLSYLSFNAVLPGQAVLWYRWHMAAQALIPGSWLLFSLSYSRSNFSEFWGKWKWPILAAFLFPACLVSFGWNLLLANAATVSENGCWAMPIGWSGYGLNVTLLLCSVLVLANLEKTLRTSCGAIRWQIKFSVLGVGILFAAVIYTSTQVLLFRFVRTDFFNFNGAILDLANILLIISAFRNRLRDERFYVSLDVLRGSLTFLVIGLYLLGLGLFAKLAVNLRIGGVLFGKGFIVIAALLGVALLLLSEKVRYRVRRFIHLNFRKPYYDYRKLFTDFTRTTSSEIDLHRVCQVIVKTVSETFASRIVTIWLSSEGFDRPTIAASTGSMPEDVVEFEERAAPLLKYVRDRQGPVFVCRTSECDIPGISPEFLEKAGIDRCAPLRIGSHFIGLMTLDKRSELPFSIEDSDLLETFADQAAGLILNRKLFESRERVMEMESFRIFSSFFAHDLKNVASTLSLTLTNLPVHYKNPEFRADALKTMSKTVDKILNMCRSLSALEQKFELHKSPCDLDELVSDTLSGLELGRPLVTDLCPAPKISLDAEQIQKVLLNLLLNAAESSGDGEQIRVWTRCEGPWLRLSVTDRGCGMSQEFINKSLFHPFRTTKQGGSGIGLYQSRMIAEAHGGRIEVQSREGHGSTFSVFLPLDGAV
ncbi:MAG: PEP-CTERM system histidine kinase PrsK [Syntrophobacteraceae bacterium]|nr:PEP-CTERM system histidine kinase PrsK [Syntrophobacteraceae bacterium]